MNIAVYLGANKGNDDAFEKSIIELGTWIGNNNHTLVYGGSKCGLMGLIAKSTLDASGKAIGVEPQCFMDEEIQFNGLTKLIVTKDMSERKNKMIELSNAFIAFPGGTGTLEEISEIMSKVSLGHLNAPCIVYNLNGFYDNLKLLLENMINKELSTKERQEKIFFVKNIKEIEDIINNFKY